jgi:hypothetical protein
MTTTKPTTTTQITTTTTIPPTTTVVTTAIPPTTTPGVLELNPAITSQAMVDGAHIVNINVFATLKNRPAVGTFISVSIPDCFNRTLTGTTDQNGSLELSTICDTKNGISGTISAKGTTVNIESKW